MNFEHTLKVLLSCFNEKNIRYAAIGGFAMGALGVPRATMDIDFLVHQEDLQKLDEVMQSQGYHRTAQTENVSHYDHSKDAWGSVDFIHAFRTFALAMLKRARPYPIFEQTQTIHVLEPEDVIGLKIQAVANNPSRRAQDVADIEALMAFYGKRLDWQRIQEYYDLFDMGSEAKQLRERFSDAK